MPIITWRHIINLNVSAWKILSFKAEQNESYKIKSVKSAEAWYYVGVVKQSKWRHIMARMVLCLALRRPLSWDRARFFFLLFFLQIAMFLLHGVHGVEQCNSCCTIHLLRKKNESFCPCRRIEDWGKTHMTRWGSPLQEQICEGLFLIKSLAQLELERIHAKRVANEIAVNCEPIRRNEKLIVVNDTTINNVAYMRIKNLKNRLFNNIIYISFGQRIKQICVSQVASKLTKSL